MEQSDVAKESQALGTILEPSISRYAITCIMQQSVMQQGIGYT
jgi:hypothetical protein